MEIRPAEAEFFQAKKRTDGQADMTKLIVAFRNFATPHPPPQKWNSNSSLSYRYHIFTKWFTNVYINK